MRKLSSLSALASAALLAAVASASAANLSPNLSVGHVTMTRPMNNVGPANIGASNQYFTPNVHGGPKFDKPVRTWVCGPIVNWDGSLHCHWVTH